jgi:DNA alkylation repair enzyme
MQRKAILACRRSLIRRMAASNISGVLSIALEVEERLRGLPRTSMATVRQLRKEYSARLADAPSFVLLELAALLLFQPGLKFRLFAYELIGCHQGALFSLRPDDLSRLGAGIDSRASADAFALAIVGPLWRERRIPDEMIYGWARSDCRWWKRIAVVSASSLVIRNGKGPKLEVRSLRILKSALTDRNSDVVSGLVSALRPQLRSNFDAVRSFLDDLEITNHPALRRLRRRRRAVALAETPSEEPEPLLVTTA